MLHMLYSQCLSDAATKNLCADSSSKEVRQEICNEVRGMASSKVQSSQLKDDLMNFSWDPLPTELSNNAPTFLKILQRATESTGLASNKWTISPYGL